MFREHSCIIIITVCVMRLRLGMSRAHQSLPILSLLLVSVGEAIARHVRQDKLSPAAGGEGRRR